jgi:hypothetical protein
MNSSANGSLFSTVSSSVLLEVYHHFLPYHPAVYRCWILILHHFEQQENNRECEPLCGLYLMDIFVGVDECLVKKKRSGRPRCTTEQEDKYIRVSSLRNRRLTSPQLGASLNSAHKTPVSMSTVKRRLWDAGLLGRVPLSSVCVLLPILIFYFYWPVWEIDFSLQLCLEGILKNTLSIHWGIPS